MVAVVIVVAAVFAVVVISSFQIIFRFTRITDILSTDDSIQLDPWTTGPVPTPVQKPFSWTPLRMYALIGQSDLLRGEERPGSQRRSGSRHAPLHGIALYKLQVCSLSLLLLCEKRSDLRQAERLPRQE